MDGDVLKETALEILKKIPPFYYLPILIFVAGLIFLVIGLIQFTRNNSNDGGLVLDQAQQQQIIQTKTPQMQVDVEGAVLHPGVYSLATGSRIKDALIAAGGLSGEADRAVMSKQLNLAVKLVDGGKVYIPRTTDATQKQDLGSKDQGSQTVLGTTTGLVNINTATAEELDALPGIGKITAQKIISARPFSSIEDLVTKKVVSNSAYQKIKEKIAVY